MSLPTGHRLAHYEILEPIGKGGMGEVYRARDTKLGRDVAIKVLPEEFARDKQRLDRFQREARLLAQLNHSNIATLYGLEEHDGQQFLVMEMVEGETLAERIAKGPVPIGEAIPLFIHIAEGLESAHDKGIIHRDLKPANIKIGPDGKPKILDFGLAKAFSPGQDVSAEASESPTLTKSAALGAVVGTPSHMSPEQARGDRVDKRTDIWAFGCCLYEALTGRSPFLAETASETLAKVLEREPLWSALPAQVPANVRKLLERCLEKDARKRLRDIGDGRYELSLTTEPVRIAPTPEQRSRPVLRWGLPGLIAGAVLFAMFSRVATPPPSPPMTRFQTEPVLANERALRPFALSSDGSRLAYVDEKDGVLQLYLRDMSTGESTLIPGTEGASNPFFSPDGTQTGFFASLKMTKVSIRGGPATEMAEAFPRGAAWLSDNRIVYQGVAAGSPLWQVSAEQGEPEPLTRLDAGKEELAHRWPAALPGNRNILFSLAYATSESWDEASIAVASLETGEHHVLFEGGSSPVYIAGHIVYSHRGSLAAVPFDAERLLITGQPVNVVDGVTTDATNGSARFSVSENGTLVSMRGGPSERRKQLVWVHRSGHVEALLEPSYVMRVNISPDGQFIALDMAGTRNTLWSFDVERSLMTRLTFKDYI